MARPTGAAGQERADLDDTLWKAADKLRGSMDAAEYKHVVLGLVFLKYVSDAFAERRPDGGRAPGAFLVPPEARWEVLADRAGGGAGGGVGERAAGAAIDAAMDAIERANPELRDALPKLAHRGGVDPRRLAELVDLIGRIRLERRPGTARDVLGQVYEYCLGRFAAAEGRRGGEFYTPQSVVRLLVEVLEPAPGSRVYDPCCGSGGMFVQAERFVESHGGRPSDISVYGQELNQNTWRLARMNLAIHGIGADLGPRPADTFHDDLHPGLRADVILANPPFNMSDWGGERLTADPRWAHGVPPAGNANFAWLQHIVSKLSARGAAGVVLANGSMSSKQSGEGAIRRALVEADLVACVVALPPQLFRTTQIPACVWFLAGGKSRRGEVLFVDARAMGTLVDRTARVLTGDDIAAIATAYRRWRGTGRSSPYEDQPGFCRSASLEEIRGYDHILTPGRYVGAAEPEDGGEPVADAIARLGRELDGHFAESARLAAAVRDQLARLAAAREAAADRRPR
ncbi:MAG TPA: type I restriction-modification system subunit M [Streptosporangiaceae bacterium]